MADDDEIVVPLGDGTRETIPHYDPSALAAAWHRIGDPDGSGTTRALRVVPNPPDEKRYAVRVGDPDGTGTVYGIDMVGATTLEDFEDGAWPDTWTGSTADFSLTASAIAGNYSLRCDAQYGDVADAGENTPRGHSYSMRTVVSSGTDVPVALLTNCQRTNPSYAAYEARILIDTGEVRVNKWAGNSLTSGLATAAVGLSYGTEYQVVLDVDDSRLRARVLDAAGTELAATAWVSESEYTGGYPGVYAGRDAPGSRFDQFQRHPLGVV